MLTKTSSICSIVKLISCNKSSMTELGRWRILLSKEIRWETIKKTKSLIAKPNWKLKFIKTETLQFDTKRNSKTATSNTRPKNSNSKPRKPTMKAKSKPSKLKRIPSIIFSKTRSNNCTGPDLSSTLILKSSMPKFKSLEIM